LPFESNGDTIFLPHVQLAYSPFDDQLVVAHASPLIIFNYFGGAIMISFPFLFVFLPFIVLSAMIIFAGKPGN
jgi:hypothetical protein